MSDTNLGVAVTADVTDLNTKLALAKADVSAFSAETKSLATQMRAAGDEGKASLLPQLQAAAASAAAARAQVASFNTALRGTATESQGAAAGLIRIRENLETLHASISTVSGAASKLGEVFLVGFGLERLADFVLKSAELGEEMLKTAQKTGISVEALSELRFAAETSGVSFDSLQTGLKKLSTAIQESLVSPSGKAAQAFTQLGITTEFLRANQNDLQAVLGKVADAYAAHADGASKSANATAIMGRGGNELIPVLDQGSAGLEKMAQRARDLGAVMGTETAEQLEEIKQKATELRLAWDQFAANITSTIAPAITTLIDGLNQLFAATSKPAQLGALNAELATTQSQIAEIQGRLASETGFSKWLDEQALSQAQQELARIQTNIEAIQGAAAGASSEGAKPQLPGLDAKDPAAQSQMQAWRDALTEKQIDERNFFRDSKADELAYWQDKLAQTTAGTKLQFEVRQQVFTLEKQLAVEQRATDISGISGQVTADQAFFDQKSAHIKELFDLGQLSSSKEAAQLKAVADAEFAQLQKDYQEKLQFQANDVQAQAQTYLEIEKLTKQHNATIAQLNQQAAKATQASWQSAVQPITTAFDGMVRGLLQGTQTFQQATANILQNVVISYAEMGVKAAVQWLASEAAKTAATIAGVASRTAAEETGREAGAAAQAISAQTSILGDAYKAAAGAYSAVAGIPFVGPVLAPIAAAVAFGAVEVFGSGVPSAAGGYDIPSGVNPLTQLHQNEMVLPANLANAVRAGASGAGGTSSSYGDTHIHVHTQASSSDTVASAVRQAARDFHPALRQTNRRRR